MGKNRMFSQSGLDQTFPCWLWASGCPHADVNLRCRGVAHVWLLAPCLPSSARGHRGFLHPRPEVLVVTCGELEGQPQSNYYSLVGFWEARCPKSLFRKRSNFISNSWLQRPVHIFPCRPRALWPRSSLLPRLGLQECEEPEPSCKHVSPVAAYALEATVPDRARVLQGIKPNPLQAGTQPPLSCCQLESSQISSEQGRR